jgi:hypothetical protein
MGSCSVTPSAAREDRYLGHRVGVLGQDRDERVAGLVDRDGMLLFGQQRVRRIASADEQPVARGVEVGCGDDGAAGSHRVDRRLVHQVGQVGAGEPRRAPRHRIEIDVRTELFGLRVDSEDGGALFLVGEGDLDGPVEAPGSQQRRVEDLGSVGRGHDDHGGAGLEAVHVREQLVERLLSLVVGAEPTRAASSSDGVDLVDEDDGR